jgi:hypothetical protein
LIGACGSGESDTSAEEAQNPPEQAAPEDTEAMSQPPEPEGKEEAYQSVLTVYGLDSSPSERCALIAEDYMSRYREFMGGPDPEPCEEVATRQPGLYFESEDDLELLSAEFADIESVEAFSQMDQWSLAVATPECSAAGTVTLVEEEETWKVYAFKGGEDCS